MTTTSIFTIATLIILAPALLWFGSVVLSFMFMLLASVAMIILLMVEWICKTIWRVFR